MNEITRRLEEELLKLDRELLGAYFTYIYSITVYYKDVGHWANPIQPGGERRSSSSHYIRPAADADQ